MISIAKSFEFAASHRLYRSDWTPEKNQQVFGKCSNPNGHGHNYRLNVTVSGEVNFETGMVMDASKLDAIVMETLIRELDHKHLDMDVPWLKGKLSTIENLIEEFWQKLEPAITAAAPAAKLKELVLHETSRIYATRARS
jgi:6-pyruvoyltetrahydropterin/6-carboxytetrahydropterin synthase